MTNEIKEILDIFKQVDLEADVGGCSNCPRKDKNKTCIGCLNNAKDKLLDYITNLQEENKNLDFDLDSYKSKYNNIKMYYEELAKENKDLQQRIDKAIEYIINHTQQSTAHLEMDVKSIKQLLNILRGDE